MIGLCRALIVDPEWPLKARLGRVRRHPPLHRLQPVLGDDCSRRADRLRVEPDDGPRASLAAARGGSRRGAAQGARRWRRPSGPQAARVAALRGHAVTLVEKDSQLGGRLKAVHAVRHHEEMKNLLDFPDSASASGRRCDPSRRGGDGRDDRAPSSPIMSSSRRGPRPMHRRCLATARCRCYARMARCPSKAWRDATWSSWTRTATTGPAPSPRASSSRPGFRSSLRASSRSRASCRWCRASPSCARSTAAAASSSRTPTWRAPPMAASSFETTCRDARRYSRMWQPSSGSVPPDRARSLPRRSGQPATPGTRSISSAMPFAPRRLAHALTEAHAAARAIGRATPGGADVA